MAKAQGVGEPKKLPEPTKSGRPQPKGEASRSEQVKALRDAERRRERKRTVHRHRRNRFGIPQTHVEGDLLYPQSPPVGGDHNSIWQNCGIYGQPIRNENGVHSLEHGSVWITYQPDLPAAQVATIKQDVRGLSFTLVSPYPNDTAPVVASAWGAQLKLQSAADPRLKEFIAHYRLNPDRTPELGAACSGGTGKPTG